MPLAACWSPDVGLGQQLVHDVQARFGVQIDGDRPLAAIVEDERGVRDVVAEADGADRRCASDRQSGASTLMTSAPQSDKTPAAEGPAIQMASSTTLTPSSTPALMKRSQSSREPQLSNDSLSTTALKINHLRPADRFCAQGAV